VEEEERRRGNKLSVRSKSVRRPTAEAKRVGEKRIG